MPPKKTTTPITDDSIKQLIAQGVADALAEYEANRCNSNGDDSHNSRTGGRRQVPTTRECTYSDFLKCQPLNFKGTKGVISLNQWLEKMTVSHEAAYGMTWKILKKMMNENYTQRFQELALMCGRMFPEESDEIEKYVGGLPDIFKEIRTFAERHAKNKRKLDNNDQAQQQPPNKKSVAIAYTVGYGERKEYAGTLPLCNKCKFYHNGQCTVKCANCNRVGHLTRDCRSPTATNNQRTLTCYECGNQGHYMSDCPKLKNQNHGNQVGGTEARGMVYALGGRETDQDLDNMEDDINA
ncbi:reverse transcriptase domain-containing protein [Tanacetum coccineum]